MAEQILKVKLQADVSTGMVSLAKAVEEPAKGMTALEKATKQMGETWKTLQDRLVSGNELIAKGIQNHGLALYNTTKAAEKYKQSLQELKNINLATNLGIGAGVKAESRDYQPFSMGLTGANRAAAEAPKLDRQQILQEAEARAFLNRRVRADQEWANSFNAVVTPAVEKNTEALVKNKETVEQVGKSHKSLLGHITEVYGAYQLVNTAVGTFKQFLMDIPKAGIQQEQTQASLFAIFGSKEGYKNIEFLKELGKSAGQYIGDLQEAYTRFAPSAMLAGATQADVNKVFKDFTETSTVLHLGTDQVKSLYLALEQMYAKTTVQSEEIKKQLGNVLPGAVEIGAKAWENYINKGKEGAARTKLSVAEFMDAMSKNLVIAKQFIPEFSDAYRKAFGGPDDSVFLDTRTKLLSNLQRLRSDYFELSDEIYKKTSSSLNEIVKLGAQALEEIKKNATGILQAIEVLSIAIAARLSASLLVNLANNLSKLTVLFTGLSASMLAVAATTVKAAAAITDLSFKYEEARGVLVAYNNETASITSTLQVVLSDAKTLLTAYLAEYKGFGSEFLKAILPDPVKAVNDFFKAYIPLTLGYMKATKQAFTEGLTYNLGTTAQQFAKDYEAQFSAYGESVITRAVEKDVTKLKEYVKGKPTYEVGKEISAQIAAGLKLSSSDITSMLESSLEIGTSNLGGSGEVKAPEDAKKKAKDLKDAYRATLEDAKNATKEIQSNIAEALGNIDTLYKANLMSIKDYFIQRKELIKTDTAIEIEGIQARLQLAFAQKDKVAVEKLQGELIKARTQGLKEETKATQEQTSAVKAYKDMLASIQSDYARTFGTMVSTTEAIDAAEQKFLATNGDKILQLEKEAQAGDKIAETRLKELYALKDNFIIQEQLTDLETKRNEVVTEYESTLQRINNQLQSGTLSPLEAGYMSDEAKDRLTTNLDDIKAKQQEVLSSQGTGVKLSDRIKREVEKSNNYLEDLKATGSRVGEGFKTVFSNSVTSAFTSFAMGTATAKQAFQSFALSIVQGIAQIIAQEIALKAVKGVMSMFSMSFGGPVSGATAATMGTGDLKMAANGDVFSGAGISAYSGSVVDKPTIFPFAKGTGLMGEAGPEAILPLKRNSQGKLGVVAESGGQSNGNVYNIAVTVQSSKDEKPADTGQKIAEAMMRTIARQEISSASRAGNALNRTTKFG